MSFKFESKEKFHVITVTEPDLTATLSAELRQLAQEVLSPDPQKPEAVRHLIVVLEPVQRIELPAAETLVELQSTFNNAGASFVVCCLQPGVEQTLELAELLDLMNTTPSESEAWDIVQMEEIERELMSGGEDESD